MSRPTTDTCEDAGLTMSEPVTATAETIKAHRTRASWSTRKKDQAPRGVFRHPSSTARATIWAIRYFCAAGHLHKEKVGPIKSDAIRAYHDRRARALGDAGWCPGVARERERARIEAERKNEARRVGFRSFAEAHISWAQQHVRSWKNTRTMLRAAATAFGDAKLDTVTSADVERFRDRLMERGASRATCNRYRDTLSGLFRRAIRWGLVTANPVKAVSKLRESGGRLLWLSHEEERAVGEALPGPLRALFTVSVHTGLRWSEQLALRWRDVDFLTGTMTVVRSKNGDSRGVPMNRLVRSVLMDLAAQRARPDDPAELVFQGVGRADRFFPPAVAGAAAALRKNGRDAGRLDGYTWHSNRHVRLPVGRRGGQPPRDSGSRRVEDVQHGRQI